MKKGTVWIILGLVCIIGAAGLTIHNMNETVRAGKASDSVLERLIGEIAEPIPVPDKYLVQEGVDPREIQYPDYILDPSRAMPTTEIDGIDYIGVLEIPRLDIELPVTAEWDYQKLTVAPCRYLGSAYLDKFIICAHNYLSHFGQLKELEADDPIYFTDMDGNRFAYRVVETEIIEPRDFEGMASGDWDLTLFTCTIGGGTRVTVRCVKVEEE